MSTFFIPKAYYPLVFSLVLLAVSLGGLFIGVIPVTLRSIDIAGEIGPLREEVTDLTSKDTALASLDSQDLQEKLAILLTAVPQDKSVASIFSLVEGIAARSGVAVIDMGVSSPGSIATAAAARQTAEEKQLGSGLVPFNVTIEGTWQQIQDFMRVSTQTRRMSQVRTFDIAVRPDGTAKASVDMDAYWSPFPAAIGRVSARITPLTQTQEEIISETSALELVSGLPEVAPAQVILPDAPENADPFAP